ncbi:50S ribosomal protein L15 [Candidatus Rubidus massiliensis]|nr:MAG: 50S ribosomal protein L15 [Chlamydia sp. 32-24]CDZ80479.1 50S ribosomal protein L15 [Candidatus Rubidus massiliensis]
MISLDNLYNFSRPTKKRKRVGRGPGSGSGKTCGRGEKGAGSRSGYKRRYGYEGGQFRTFMKLPIRGFSNAQFRREYKGINLSQIDAIFEDGEVVSIETLALKGLIRGKLHGIKILGDGQLTKKVTIEADAISASAKEKLQQANIPFTIHE